MGGNLNIGIIPMIKYDIIWLINLNIGITHDQTLLFMDVFGIIPMKSIWIDEIDDQSRWETRLPAVLETTKVFSMSRKLRSEAPGVARQRV